MDEVKESPGFMSLPQTEPPEKPVGSHLTIYICDSPREKKQFGEKFNFEIKQF